MAEQADQISNYYSKNSGSVFIQNNVQIINNNSSLGTKDDSATVKFTKDFHAGTKDEKLIK